MPTIALFKPYDVLCKFTDAEGRPTLADYVNVPGVYSAGRLDQNSEGLVLLTSDGKLAQVITSPEQHMTKIYLAQVEHIPDEAALRALRRGVEIKGRITRPARVELLNGEPNLPSRPVPIRYRKNVPTAWVQISLIEGRNHQVRRMTAAVGYPTLRLVRIAIGPIRLDGLQPGEWRTLTQDEISAIWRWSKGQRRRG